MPHVLTVRTTVTCGHTPGKVTTASSAKLTVSGVPVLLPSSIGDMPVTGCPLLPPPQGTVACKAVVQVQQGAAAKLSVGGEPVVLDTLSGSTNGSIPTDVPPTPQTHLAAPTGEPKLQAS
ncbi:hypothetical protein [Kitasatospora azatica]|uniref:hypothetical protein n=1 Tax=Kitasatospora azatica TaxID=58347 RepID=UPI0012FB6197|nr:hypothetical protein [Kitasatospora azatica]